MAAPATLPANFTGWDKPSSTPKSAPDTLPANFSSWDAPAQPSDGKVAPVKLPPELAGPGMPAVPLPAGLQPEVAPRRTNDAMGVGLPIGAPKPLTLDSQMLAGPSRQQLQSAAGPASEYKQSAPDAVTGLTHPEKQTLGQEFPESSDAGLAAEVVKRVFNTDIGTLVPRAPEDSPEYEKIQQGAYRFLGSMISPKQVAIGVGTAGAAEAVPALANLPIIAERLKDMPQVLKSLDLLSRTVVPAAIGVAGAKGMVDSGIPTNLEDATTFALNALMAGAGVAGAVSAGHDALITGKVISPPEAPTGRRAVGRPSAEELGGIETPSLAPGEAKAKAEALSSVGRNLTAQLWKNLDHTQPTEINTTAGKLYLQPTRMVDTPVTDNAGNHVLDSLGKPKTTRRAYQEVLDANGKQVVAGTAETVRAKLNQMGGEIAKPLFTGIASDALDPKMLGNEAPQPAISRPANAIGSAHSIESGGPPPETLPADFQGFDEAATPVASQKEVIQEKASEAKPEAAGEPKMDAAAKALVSKLQDAKTTVLPIAQAIAKLDGREDVKGKDVAEAAAIHAGGGLDELAKNGDDQETKDRATAIIEAQSKPAAPVKENTPEISTKEEPLKETSTAADNISAESRPGQQVTEQKPLHELSLEELDAAQTEARGRDKQDLVDLFGEDGAKQYAKLQSVANSSTRPVAEAEKASSDIATMEEGLTEPQRNRLFGIGDERPQLEDIKDYRNALGGIDTSSPEALGKSLRFAIAKVGTNLDPSKMNHAQKVALAQLRYGFEQARELGYDTKAVSLDAIKGAAERFSDPEDAADMLGHLRGLGREPKAEPKTEVPRLTAATNEEAPKHDYHSTHVNLPDDYANKVREFGAKIPDAALAEDGREDEPHVTVKYGLKDPAAADKVRELMADEGPIKAKVGKVSIFPASKDSDYDVVKFDVQSEDLNRLNKKIADALPNDETHPEYHPHVTIAYVKKGEGKKYAGRAVPGMTGKEITFNSLKFSAKDGTKVDIPLGSKSEVKQEVNAPVVTPKETAKQQPENTTQQQAFRMGGPELKALATKGDTGAQAEIDYRAAKKRGETVSRDAFFKSEPKPTATPSAKPAAAKPNEIQFEKRGDFYETYGEQAVQVAQALGITKTTSHDGRDMAGIPAHRYEQDVAELKSRGFQVRATGESKLAAPAKNVANEAAARLRTSADGLTKQIEGKRNSGVSQQNPTARRNRIAANMANEADRLERIQKGLNRLAELHDSGEVPDVLSRIRTRATFEELMPRYTEQGKRVEGRRFTPAYLRSRDVDEILEKTKGTSGTVEGRAILQRKQGQDIAYFNPFTLQANPNYAYRNDRNYADPRNSERIVTQTTNFDPSFVLTDSPTAVDGAPIVDRNGNVIGGNSRAMTIARVYGQRPEVAARYKASLVSKAARFGLDAAEVEVMKEPVLVRELTTELGADDAQSAITDLNKSGTAALSTSERAIADSNRVSEETLDQLAGMIEAEGPTGTLAAALDGKAGAFIVDRLIKDGVITTQEKPSLFDNRGTLTPSAKERISKLMLGRVFHDSAQFESAPPALRNKLERVVAPLARVAGKDGWDLLSDVQNAVSMIEEARATNTKNLDDLVAQQGLFGGGESYSPRTVMLAKAINSLWPVALAKTFNRYANDSKGPTMFGEVTPKEAFADAFGSNGGLKTAIEAREESVKDKINALISEAGSTTSAGLGLSGELLMAYAELGALKIAKGMITFAAWSKEMLDEYGATLKPHLEKIWKEAQKLHGEGITEGITEEPTANLDRPAGTSQTVKESRLAQGVEQQAIANKLTTGFEGRPEYQTVNIADQSRRAQELVDSDPDQAIQIAMGRALPPHGLLPESVFVSVENHATAQRDVDLLRRLATASSLSMEATGMGQRIRMLGERNPDSPVAVIEKVVAERQKVAEKKFGKKAKDNLKKSAKAEIKKQNAKVGAWAAFISEITCK